MKTDTSYRLLKRLWVSYIRSYRYKILLAVLVMGLSAASTAGLAKMMESIIDDVFKSENIHMLKVVGIFVLGLFIIKGVAAYAESLLMNFVGQRIISNIQKDLFAHLVHADLSYFHSQSTGVLISRCTNDVNLMKGAVSNTITSFGKDILTVVFLVALMFYQDFFLAALSFFVFPVAVLPIARIGKRMRKVSISTQKETGFFLSLLKEIFQGARLVKAYGMEAYEIGRANKTIEDLFRLSIKSNRIKSLGSPIMETLGGIAIVVVISYGGYQVISGHNTAGAFFSFISALLLAYEPMKRLVNLNATLQEGLAATQRIFSVLDQKPKIQDCAEKKAEKGHIKNGDIVFSNVSFSYDTGKEVLKNVSLTIKQGEQVALVGQSGAGKSTLMNLLLRFYEPSHGSILIDGRAIDKMTFKALREGMALVSQEIILFDDTVKANILYGRKNASMEEVIIAAKKAAAHHFIQALPKGYDTSIGESGVRLSGGQRQRLSIARAILKDAPILLLDEATSSLDTESEHQVQKALDRLMKGRTSVIIAHRLSTVRQADKIFVLEKGKIVESGTHDHLLKKKDSVYAGLCQWQLAGS
ncbi:MAG: ABC transporter permease [Alphaproteobacteria bacterium RIFCSPHIGHO2_01_FULL_41_14]|nr:MAG: ABC transporter permease [Alphaproteobacteria bacterium GWB1_45_5]OFW76310.1 MAG: ABC transporter permease [Alphaproteobacteria bacterium GWA1_45_9]OFW89418.1 MAG: ABC transporter permease [Alphaproteobacteria bacterium RIFCSPHIGHO2_01_FULL_41_14]HCI48686.1 ABC transporter permease [Holosporales bacterium]